MKPRRWLALGLALLSSCIASRTDTSVDGWMRRAAVPIADRPGSVAGVAREIGANVLVVGLGEATHGQHECFDFRRELTLELVREHGFRVVAYEASAASARACDEYIAGRTHDLAAAQRGLGMLIWQIEENAQLLRDLRELNRGRDESQRVHFVGIDVQDPRAACARLIEVLAAREDEFAARWDAWAESIAPAVQNLWSGDASTYTALREQFAALERETLERAPNSAEVNLRLLELRWAADMFQTAGGRDRAMAELLLAQLGETQRAPRAVLWAHNAHVSRGPLRYQNSEELAAGGHLGEALGERYYAVGVAFGAGEFQANAPMPDGRFGFRRYRVGLAAQGTLDARLAAALGDDAWLDLRRAPRAGAIATWLETPHGQRWFGGYGVSEDPDADTRDAAGLPPTIPRHDFDALLFFAHTSAAQPVDRSRLVAPASTTP